MKKKQLFVSHREGDIREHEFNKWAVESASEHKKGTISVHWTNQWVYQQTTSTQHTNDISQIATN